MGFWDKKEFVLTNSEMNAYDHVGAMKNIVESRGELLTPFSFHPGWALSFVTDEKPIPEECRDRFYNELVSENVGYRELLEEAIRKHGVRWN